MYLSFYQLQKKPFQITTDPRFLWFSEKHREALATLKYAILDNKGFLLLTGDIGTGKTTLINCLTNSLGPNFLVAKVVDPRLSRQDFFKSIADAFGLPCRYTGKSHFLKLFRIFLNRAHQESKQVLLILDEAQRFHNGLLEEVRMLSNIEREDTKLLNIFFIGQNEFNDTLLRKENRAIRQRITIKYTLNRLSHLETGQYINHRLQVAGATTTIFLQDAIHEIYQFSGGTPRLINIICDLALLTGFTDEKPQINGRIIRECARELEIHPFESNQQDVQKIPPPPLNNDNAEMPTQQIHLAHEPGKEEPEPREDFIPNQISEKIKNPRVIFFIYIVLIGLTLGSLSFFFFSSGIF